MLKLGSFSLAIGLTISSAGAGTVYVDCADYGIPVPHSALAHVTHVAHHKPRHHYRAHRHAKAHHGSRTALLRKMCPVWLDDSLGGPAGAWPSSGWFEETAGTDFGTYGEVAIGGAGSAGGGEGESVAFPFVPQAPPTFIVSAAPTPLGALPIPFPSPGPGITTPVPELSSWLLMLIGFAAIWGLSRLSPILSYARVFTTKARQSRIEA
jgi:hypothetical protein